MGTDKILVFPFHFNYLTPITVGLNSHEPKNITPKMVSYWEKRASEVDNPILQCRYAGLVWDFSQKTRNSKPDISNAHRFIDSIIEMSCLGGDSFLEYKLERAIRLAVSLNDQNRIAAVRDSIIKYEETHFEEDKPGTWGYSFDLLIGDKNLYRKVQLEEKQEDKIIKELERKLKILSDKDSNTFNPHSVEYIVKKLAPYYKDKNEIENTKRILLIYRDSFLHGIKNNLVMVGSHWLDKIRKILFQYGLSKEAQELEYDIRRLQKEDLKYFTKIEMPVKIPKQHIENYIKELDKKNLSEALNLIAVSFVPNKEQTKNIVLENAKKSPLLARIPQAIMDYTGRKTVEFGSVEEDLEGHIVRQISQSMPLRLYWIVLGLEHLKKNKSLNENTLSEHLFKSFVFPEVYHQVVKEGVAAYFNGNYIASCSILIHQIESSVRELISQIGGAIYQPVGFDLKPLGSLLKDIRFIKTFEKLNHNIPDYLQVLLTDRKGLNLRNSICHGFSTSSFFNQNIATCIIHILLILSLLRLNKSSYQNNNS